MAADATETTALTEAAQARPRRRPTGRLVAVHPPTAVGVVDLDADEVLVGREHGPVRDKTLSRRHLAIRWDAGAFARVAEDLGSKNGSSIDRVRLAGAPRVLNRGAVIRAGDVLFVYDEVDDARDHDESDERGILVAMLPGDAFATRSLRALVARAAADRAPVLLLGETGTGKEHVARALHRISDRGGPFVAVSCAELSDELMASQLFGHARGAFTDAGEARPGLFRSAAGGTLLLDEIGELPPSLQPKLLRVLQEGEVLPIGEVRPVGVDVRVIAATHAPLESLVVRGGFRRDLFARLAFWPIPVPPLRARRADLLAWLAHFHRRFAEQRGLGTAPLGLNADAAEAILLAPWPENLRGLDRLVHRLAGRAGRGPVALDELPSLESIGADEVSESAAVQRATPSRDELAELMASLGSVRAVAKHLGRDRRQIYRWLETFGLRSPSD